MRDLAAKLGGRMRRFRLAADMSQGELARVAGLTKSYLSDVERGKVNISIANLDRIAEGLKVPLAVLLDCEDLPQREEIMRDLAKLPDDVLLAVHRLAMHLGRRRELGITGHAPRTTVPDGP